ncbi:PREDICTED: pyrroline-5-carboxylate reductase 3-like [Rhagoletis zephyria]|uniref:pyrroline-5-carboxylate reductase 3-like n=1 Tax=Rhagoletis zephyria TaxID=28612 RepID=UPI0008112DF1|nr:PREDICTED: pyrroline-5-carboxylate reductase 3-like [Rhagoletis zephyria]
MSDDGSKPPSDAGADAAPSSGADGAPASSGPAGGGAAEEAPVGAAPASGTGATPGDKQPSAGGTGAEEGAAGASAGAASEDPPAASATKSSAAAGDKKVKSSEKPKSGEKAPSRTGASKSSVKSTGSGRKRGAGATLENARIGFLGAGKLVEAIVKGLVGHAKVAPGRIYVSSKSGRSLDGFKQNGCVVTKRNYDLFAKLDCDVVFVAVHGHVIRELFKLGGTRPVALTTNYIPNQRHPLYLLSLVGGIPLTDLKQTLLNPDHPDKYKLEAHRVMLNASVAYGLGLGALDIEPDSKKCATVVRDVLTSVAKLEYFPETTMDAVCALGGNGLAFVHYFISALSDGGFKMGMPKVVAVKMATKTLQSAAACLLESGKHPSDLRDACTSPSGPAIYGLHLLESKDTASGLAAAVEGAFKRVRELVESK